MQLRDALGLLKRLEYDRRAAKTQPAQAALYQLRREPPEGIPLGLELRVSGQGINLPVVPWITLLDPSVTTKVTEGLYIVYLFDAELERVFLTMNQGATQHRDLHLEAGLTPAAAERAALAEISAETSAIREILVREVPDLPVDTVDLGSVLFLPTAYEIGAISARRYEIDALPSEAELRNDLAQFNLIYQRAVTIKEQLVANQPQVHRTSARARTNQRPVDPEPVFRPKDGNEYTVSLVSRLVTVSPRHEALIRSFGDLVEGLGWTPATNVHPRDMVVTAEGHLDWLVEAKTVGANAEFAVREAIGQLFTYRHFYYRELGRPDPRLLALFSEPVGQAFVVLLSDLGIETVWSERSVGWGASPGAAELLASA